MGVEPLDGSNPFVDLFPTGCRPFAPERLMRTRMAREDDDPSPLGQLHRFDKIERKTGQHHGFETWAPGVGPENKRKSGLATEVDLLVRVETALRQRVAFETFDKVRRAVGR